MSEHSESENSDAVNKSSIIQDKSIPIPERNIRANDKKLELNFPQTIS